MPGYGGAYLSGSAAWLSPDMLIPRSSDVDLTIVLGPGGRPGRSGKLAVGRTLLDVSWISSARLASAAAVLGDYHLASAFSRRNLLDDPTGDLDRLSAAVRDGFTRRRWVDARVRQASDKVLRYVRVGRVAPSLPDRAIAWLFAAGITTHVLLVAGLRNPTVRRRYADVRELLVEHGRSGEHELLLELLGCTRMSAERARHHLEAMAAALDLAAAIPDPPFPFASDLTAAARPIAVDGSRELIDEGLHREAVFWITVTFSRCAAVAHLPTAGLGRSDLEHLDASYLELLSDLGAASRAEIEWRAALVRSRLPDIRALADMMIEADPRISEA